MGFGNLQRFLPKAKKPAPEAKPIFLTPEPAMGATITAVPQAPSEVVVQNTTTASPDIAVTPTIDGSEDLRIEPVTQTNAEHGMFAGALEPANALNGENLVLQKTAESVVDQTSQSAAQGKKKFSLRLPSLKVLTTTYFKKIRAYIANVRKGIHVYKLIITSVFAFFGFTGVFVYLTIRMNAVPEVQQYDVANLPELDLRPIALARTLTVQEKYDAYIALQAIPQVAELLAVVNQTAEVQAEALRDHPAMAKDAQKRALEQITILQNQLRLQKNLSDEHMMQITTFGEQNSLKAPELEPNSPQHIASLATKAYLDPSPEALMQAYVLYNIAAVLGQAESNMIVVALDPLGLQNTDQFAMVLEQRTKELGIDLNTILHASAPEPVPVPEPVPTPTPVVEESSSESSVISSSIEQSTQSSMIEQQSSSIVQSQSSSLGQNTEVNLPPTHSESSVSLESSIISISSSSSEIVIQSSSSSESIQETKPVVNPANLKPNKRFFRACGSGAQSDITLCTLQ